MCASASLENGSPSTHSNSEDTNEIQDVNDDSNRIPIPSITSLQEILDNYGPNFKVLECNAQVGELLTIIRDK